MKQRPAPTKTIAIIPSSGLGLRMGFPPLKGVEPPQGGGKKNYLPLLGRPVLAHTLAVLEDSPHISSVIIAVTPGDETFCLREIVEKHGFKKVAAVVAGGKERQDSVLNALNAVSGHFDVVAVHDGARPLVTGAIIERTVTEAARTGAAICAVRVKDTIKDVIPHPALPRAPTLPSPVKGEEIWKVSSRGGDMEGVIGFVANTVPRDRLWAVQTPQAFHIGLLKDAFKRACDDRFLGTDESSLVERLGVKVSVVEGSYENIKITTPEDLALARFILEGRA